MEQRSPPRRILTPGVIAIVLISTAFVMWSAAFISRTTFIHTSGARYTSLFDDAMISMRYAWNFAHGHGLVWNPGEHVQGYTSLLMTLVMTLSALVFDKAEAVLAIQLLGIPVMLAIAAITAQLAGMIFAPADGAPPQVVRVVGFICGLAYYPLAYWSLMGMETGLLTVFLLAGLLLALRFSRGGPPRDLWISAAFFGLAYLTRSDSILFFVLVWLYLAFHFRGHRPLILLGPALLVTAVASAQTIFQLAYYGQVVPNTYILKLTGMPMLPRLANGLGFVALFLREISLLLVFAVVGLVISPRPEKLLALGFVLLAIAYQVFIGGDASAYWRFMAPAVPLLLILGADALFVIMGRILRPDRAGATPRLRSSFMLAVSVPFLFAAGQANGHFLLEAGMLARPFQAVDNELNVRTALALKDVLRPGASIAVAWAGTIPFYTDFRAIDMLGKCDAYIAALPPDLSGSVAWEGMTSVPGHNKYDLNYSIVELQPTYVQYVVYGRQDLTAWAAQHYVTVNHEGVELRILRDSPDVDWSRLAPP